jgi:hypothetical protein
VTAPALDALRADVEDLAAEIHILVRAAAGDEDLRRALLRRARQAEAITEALERLATDEEKTP